MNLIDALRLIIKRWKVMLVVTMSITILVGAVCWQLLPNMYRAQVTFYVLGKQVKSNSLGIRNDDGSMYRELQSAQLMANDFAEIANSQDLRDTAAFMIGESNIDDYDIHVAVTQGTRVITLYVVGPNAGVAAEITRALATCVSDTAVKYMGVRAVNTIGSVSTAPHAVGPQRKLYCAAACFIGFALAGIYVVGEAIVNTRVRSEEDLRDVVPIPVFGHVATVGRG